MVTIGQELAGIPAKTALLMIEFCRNRLAASEARVLPDRYDKGASDRDVEDLAASGGKTSKKEAKKRAPRAKPASAGSRLAAKISRRA